MEIEGGNSATQRRNKAATGQFAAQSRLKLGVSDAASEPALRTLAAYALSAGDPTHSGGTLQAFAATVPMAANGTSCRSVQPITMHRFGAPDGECRLSIPMTFGHCHNTKHCPVDRLEYEKRLLNTTVHCSENQLHALDRDSVANLLIEETVQFLLIA